MGAETRSWEPEEIFAELERDHGSAAPQIIRNVEQRLDTEYSGSAVTIQWRGSKYRAHSRAALLPWIVHSGVFYFPPICFRVTGKVEVPFQRLREVPERWNEDFQTIRTPFNNEEKRRELRDRLNEVPLINLKSGKVTGRPTFDLHLLQERETLDRLIEVFDWYVGQIVPHEQRPGIQQKLDHRRGMWNALLDAGGPKGVVPSVLRDLGIYGGAQGVWVDKSRTGSLTEDGAGTTVGLLHTGSSYADDLSDDGVLYHYPSTNRPRGRDVGEIEATKAAGRLGLPVFVITYPSPGSARRNVHLGWVESWDDSLETYLITFGESQPSPLVAETEEQPFRLVEERRTTRRQVDARIGQQRFKFLVLQRYGERCAVCGISAPQLLDAAHLRPKSERGSDDPRNGLVLCASHHRALDTRLFAIEPGSLRLRYTPSGPGAASLRMDYSTLEHLRKKPHAEALKWLWNRWQR